jgi:hypothetical protein
MMPPLQMIDATARRIMPKSVQVGNNAASAEVENDHRRRHLCTKSMLGNWERILHGST